MPLDAQICAEVQRYVDRITSLDEFRDWFVPRSWSIEESRNVSDIALAHQIDGILGESSSANWSEEDIREELANAILPFVSRNRIQHSRVVRNYLTSNVVDEHSQRPPINQYWADLSVELAR